MAQHSQLSGCVVLVVEDEPLVSLDLVDILSAAGAHVVCANSAYDAILSVERFKVTAAVLDIKLGNHDCAGLCRHLAERGLGFVFHTGYAAPLDGWANIPVVKKPAARQDITDAVARLCRFDQEVA
jgi:CheY-like chemotaxis protein